MECCKATSSCCSDYEGGIEVAINDKVGQGVILANLVLLGIDLAGQDLVEIHVCVLARRSSCPHRLNVQLLLQIVCEAHDHVESIAL